MGQDEVYKIIKNSKKPISGKEIREKINISSSPVYNSLNKLIKWGEVKYIEKEVGANRVRFYFI